MDDLEDDLKEYKLSSAADITSSGDPTDKVLKDFGREMVRMKLQAGMQL